MKYHSIAQAALLGCCVAGPLNLATADVKPNYQPFPTNPEYSYPTPWSKIQEWIDNGQWSEIREHGWRLFIGANLQASTDAKLRIFETWYDLPVTFAPPAPVLLGATESRGTTQPTAMGHRKALNKVESALYGNHAVKISPDYNSPCGFAGSRFLNNGDLMIAGVYFSKEFYDHVQTNGYYSQATLNKLWEGESAAIKNFPDGTLQVKVMQWPVPHTGYAALPVFPQFNPARDPDNPKLPVKPRDPRKFNGYETWNDAVAVTVGTPAEKSVDVTYAWRDVHNAPTVSIDNFYHTQIDQATYDRLDDTDKCILNQSANGVYGRKFQPGDYLITIAMHLTAREKADVASGLLPNPQAPKTLQNTWSLQSFWYDRSPAGNEGVERYRLDKPKDIKPGAWSNYAMCQSYDAIEPKEGDGTPHVCSNPYIELAFPETYRSVASCITCHMAGAYPSASSLTDTTPGRAHYNSEKRGEVPLKYFNGLLYSDFSWAIPLSAQPDVNPNQ